MSPWPGLVTVLALMLYLAVTINVSRARAQYKIPVPQMTGNPDFERVVRVHYNTLEQLVSFLPLLWIFSLYINPIWGSIIGAVWVLGRALYAWGYYQATEKRGPGFAIGSLCTALLLLGSLGKIAQLAFQSFI